MTSKEKDSMFAVIDSNFVMSIATIQEKLPAICTVFYVTSGDGVLYFKSSTKSGHSLAIKDDPNVAVSIYDPKSNYSSTAGVQLLGQVERVMDLSEMTKAVGLYTKAFVGSDKKLEAIPNLITEYVTSTLYKFIIAKVKVRDSGKDISLKEYSEV